MKGRYTMISMITDNGNTRIHCAGDKRTLAAECCLIALNACRLYAEHTAAIFGNKQAAALDIMQIVLQEMAKEGDTNG